MNNKFTVFAHIPVKIGILKRGIFIRDPITYTCKYMFSKLLQLFCYNNRLSDKAYNNIHVSL